MPKPLIVRLNHRTQKHIGHKAESLKFLMAKGFRIPSTYLCVWDAHERYQVADPTLKNQLRIELDDKLAKTLEYAVRSSANVEDGQKFSFAGQFQSVLNVKGTDNLLAAIQTVWESIHTDSVRAYLDSMQMEPGPLKMAVLLQEMVTPVASGVVFSKNPLTGLDELIVESIAGSGKALLQGSVQPARWVYKWGTWICQPEVPPVPQPIIQTIVEEAQVIARKYGKPVDLEWVYDGKLVYWVQLRSITSLDNVAFYSNRIAKEVLPGLIKPLIWSVNIPLVNSAWVRLLTELVGPNDIDPLSLSKSFYGRAYFNMGTMGNIFELLGFPRETLELLMGLEQPGPERPNFRPTRSTFRHLPRIMRFAFDKWWFERKIKTSLPDLKDKYAAYQIDNRVNLDEHTLLDTIDDLFTLTQDTAYYNIVIPLLMQFYHAVLNRQLTQLEIDPATFDLTADFEPLRQLNPSIHLHQLLQLFQILPGEVQTSLLDEGFAPIETRTDIDAFRRGVAEFIERFGHLSDSGNDFSVPPWREQPEIVLRIIGEMSAAPINNNNMRSIDELSIPWQRRWPFLLFYQRARQFQLYREQISSLYTYGYGLFRHYFLELGDHLVRRNIIAESDDIFFLYLDEIRDLIEHNKEPANVVEQIASRKSDMADYTALNPPEIVFGDTPAPSVETSGDQLTGVATSRGYYRGKVCVIHGIQEFAKLDAGDVLVIPYSDVGWTPLFAKAGAVISESGGMLSHSSIIARELNIPAVVSVPLACQLHDGTIVIVDGYKGEIYLEQELI